MHGYDSVLLAFSPFEDDLSQDADHHLSFMEFVLNLFGKSMDNVLALVGDNCSVNTSLARQANTHFV